MRRNQKLEQLMITSEVTGLAAAFVEQGAITEVHTLGTMEGTLVHPETLWAVASLTKPVFGYGVLQLVEQGVIDLDCPLQAYLPTPYLEADPYLPQMTARHALTHSTGFPNWRDAQGLRATFAPGTRFSYSSEGLTYLQFVVEHLLNVPLRTYLAQDVFAPLGMHQTELGLEQAGGLRLPLHFLSGTLLANGALSLRTSIRDYARFMATMLDDSPQPPRLGSAWRKEMLRPQIAVGNIPSLFWGLGWGAQQSRDGLSFWHWGARGIPQTMSFAVGIPEQRRAAVIFTNHSSGLYLCQNILHAWLGEGALPAFEWLLPAQEWRPDGKKRMDEDAEHSTI